MLAADDDAAVPRDRLPRRSGGRHLPFDFGGDALREPPAGRDQHRARVRIVLGLREQIGGDPSRAVPEAVTIRISVGPA